MRPEVPLIILILGIPIYLLSKWILNKLNIGNAKSRKFIAIIPTVFLSPIAYSGIIMIWIYSISYHPSNEFNKIEWKSNIEERYKMSEDLIESKILIGKTKEEVIELLGNDYSTNGENCISYYLGFVPGFANIDPDVLDINFENGKAISVSQHET
jgi:hypothetical protein